MLLSLAEIKTRAIKFSKEWENASRERSESQTFWNEFFEVFGRTRKLVATFEEPVKNIKGKYDFIDLFWRETLIAESKSRGKDLSKANSQAVDYIQSLVNSGRGDEAPRYLLLTDFARLALIDLEDDSQSFEIPLSEFHKHIRAFAFIAGYQTRKLDPEDPANEKAVEKLAHLHDELEAAHFVGHPLERFLVRILFCLFADDTGIFEEPQMFERFILNHTKHDGSDLGPQLTRLFQVLDTPRDRRSANLSEDLAAFPYVNGQLFTERLDFPEFTSTQRDALVKCCHFQWAKISPAIFGSLFQAAMQPKERRQIGAHYTSERDIMKLIRSLFLDDLRDEFEKSKKGKKQLAALHDKIASLKFLDPACGCGNFLVITYRELRFLELDILKELHIGDEQRVLNIGQLIRVNVDQLYGIEIEEWPARIAEVALWLLDHQMNQIVSEAFGNHYIRLPLRASPSIHVANALHENWHNILPANECSYILGNPPFVGKQYMTTEQKTDMSVVFENIKGSGVLDYVTAWYIKTSSYINKSDILCAFVSTNSITQGEQAGVLWPELFRRGIHINFAHRTFSWMSEARGKAHVHVVIIGFAHLNITTKKLYDYDADETESTLSYPTNISPYLADGGNTAVISRTVPINGAPRIVFGSMPNDGGNLLLSDEEKNALVAEYPEATNLIRPFLGSHEFINGKKRWCLWLINANPTFVRRIKPIADRIELVRKCREESTRNTTQELAKTPGLFGENRQPTRRYLAIPKTSSERRSYIPMAFLHSDIIASTELFSCENATCFHFGVLSSSMHMAWVNHVCGRLKSDYRYSSAIVYNNFPWPENITERQHRRIEECAQAVLDAREPYLEKGASFADLYDPLAMPKPLVDSHRELDQSVDRLYRPQPFVSNRKRFEFLFEMYERLIAPLAVIPKKRQNRS